jgi:hypothetical protein
MIGKMLKAERTRTVAPEMGQPPQSFTWSAKNALEISENNRLK